MKKLYSFLFSGMVIFSTFASNPTILPSRISGLEPNTVQNLDKNSGKPMSAKESFIANDSQTKSTLAVTPIGEWTVIGEGAWVEGPMDLFSDVKAGVSTPITVEESTTTSGQYRVTVYGEGSALAELLGRANTTQMIIHAEDPDKVWTEDVTVFNTWQISNAVEECGWTAENLGDDPDFPYYGTLRDNIITFPAYSHLVYSSGWKFGNKNGKFAIYLPGAEIVDYNLDAVTLPCNNQNEVAMKFSAGADIADIKVLLLKGNYSANEQNLAATISSGTSVAPDEVIPFSLTGNGRYTVLVAALNNADEIVNSLALAFFGIVDDNDNWRSLGTGSFTEPFLHEWFSDLDQETFDVAIEENINTRGYYRIVNPYSTHPNTTVVSWGLQHDHNHYIYINATNPDAVVVEESPSGLRNANGDFWIGSPLGYFSNTAEELENYGYATPTKTDLTITFPAKSVFSGYNKIAPDYFLNDGPGSLILPDSAGVEDIVVDNDSNAPVEYFNLQGVRVDNPGTGIYIRRQGNTVSKIAVK